MQCICCEPSPASRNSAKEIYHVAPMVWSGNHTIETGRDETFAMTGAMGLNLQPGQDAAKVVTSSVTCAASAAAGTSVVSDLGPSDSENSKAAQATFSFAVPGKYHVCYKLAGSTTYQEAGSVEIEVTPLHPSPHPA